MKQNNNNTQKLANNNTRECSKSKPVKFHQNIHKST
jgi:hypothetical protein